MPEAMIDVDTPRRATVRLHVAIRGTVQGVGFRPFIYRLATEMSLPGWVQNSSHGVFIEIEGTPTEAATFLDRVQREKPAIASIYSLEPTYLDPLGYEAFEIRPSEAGERTAVILPDIAICGDCHRELFDPADRRFRYPFLNCTNCGPRFTIIESLPYDRSGTSMKRFTMCEACRAEYENPLNRRFHAQPNACPECGPQLAMRDNSGSITAERDEALRAAIETLQRGDILALKGIGGFHLMVDARNDTAVKRLRLRKLREEKPFALMFPSLESLREICEVTSAEERLLLSPEMPIVLVRRSVASTEIAAGIAPHNPFFGVMLPYSPLHHLLLSGFGGPVVATSGNLSDEPICIDNDDAIQRLGSVADVFLTHDRPIVRHADDSIARIVMDREMILRRARGYAPLPLRLVEKLPRLLAVGAHQKNTIALSVADQLFVSQHIGDLESAESQAAFESTIDTFQRIYEFVPELIACDLHPDYSSTAYARRQGVPVEAVQHHYAHVLSCMADNSISGAVLGVAWDGSGYGPDGTIWGGEFLKVGGDTPARLANFRTFSLPGGEKGVKEPRRSAIGLLYEAFGESAFDLDIDPVASFDEREKKLLLTMLQKKLNTPTTSSVGRLFDAVAAIVGLRQTTSFEGQAAMELEYALNADAAACEPYPVRITGSDRLIIDWTPMVRAIVGDVQQSLPVWQISGRFHNALAQALVDVATACGIERVVLTGGCFQNRYLTERAIQQLRAAGLRPYWHQRIPPNDGGISVGQAIGAGRAILKERLSCA